MAFASSCATHDEPARGQVNQAYGDPPPPPPDQCPPPDGTRPDPTVINVDSFVLNRFPLKRVLDQLVTIQGTGQSLSGFYSQLWDATDVAPGLFPEDPHCDDVGAINDFKLACPAPDAVLKKGDMSDFVPTALTNRFDLAPKDGSTCGEYRIVFARTGGKFSGRDFIIFEGALPNPTPDCGIESCRPVVELWEKFAGFDPGNPADQTALGDLLEEFFFKGWNGFEPVVHPGHYGMDGGLGYAGSHGQVRLNMFADEERWRLREDHIVEACTKKAGCHLQFLPVTVKTNPAPDLYNASSPEPRAPGFQSAFPAEIPALGTDDINTISMSVSDKHNAGESNSQIIGTSCGPSPADNDDDLNCVNLGGPPNAFTAAVDSQLLISRPDLTHDDAFNRATTQTCAGCHEISNGANLGGGGKHPTLTWPFSRRFVHIDESSFLSQALWCEFLPFRKKLLDNFFNLGPQGCGPKGKLHHNFDTVTTMSGKPVGSAN